MKISYKIEGTDNHLTKREIEMCIDVKRALRVKAIGSRFYISPRTVNFHMTNIYRKLKVTNKVELINRLDEMGFFDSEACRVVKMKEMDWAK